MKTFLDERIGISKAVQRNIRGFSKEVEIASPFQPSCGFFTIITDEEQTRAELDMKRFSKAIFDFQMKLHSESDRLFWKNLDKSSLERIKEIVDKRLEELK